MQRNPNLASAFALLATTGAATAAALGFASMHLFGVVWHEFAFGAPVGYWASTVLVVLFGMVRSVLNIQVSTTKGAE